MNANELELLDETLDYLNEGILSNFKEHNAKKKALKEKGKKVYDAMQRRARGDEGIDVKFKFIIANVNDNTVSASIGAAGTLGTSIASSLNTANGYNVTGQMQHQEADAKDRQAAKDFREYARSSNLFDEMKEQYDFVKDIRFDDIFSIYIVIKK